MTIKDFGSQVEQVWEGLRPLTKKLLVGAIDVNQTKPSPKLSYDAHADWELSRLLSALDDQAQDTEIRKDVEKRREIKNLADACASLLETKTESAEVFIQLAKRALARNNFKKLDALADFLAERFSPTEIAEIIRQTDLAQIRAIAYETLALVPTISLLPVLEDPIYFEIARNALEQQAIEYENDEAQMILEQLGFEELSGE